LAGCDTVIVSTGADCRKRITKERGNGVKCRGKHGGKAKNLKNRAKS
jgi:hypothetical protein